MPVRKIPKSYRSVTGQRVKHDSTGSAGFESTLERDLYVLLAFDPRVSTFEEQPLTINFSDATGKARRYTPDTLVTYVDDTKLLVEVKYVEKLKRLIREEGYAQRIRAARAYARLRGWRYRVYTERDIRTPLLFNARFLLAYRKRSVPINDQQRIINLVRQQSEVSVHRLLEDLACGDRDERSRLVVAVWHLVANHRLHIDLERARLNDHSLIRGLQ